MPDEDKNASAEQKPLTHPYSEGRRMQESGQDSYAGAGQSEGTSQEKPKYGHYEVHQPQAGNYAGGNIPPKKPRKKRDFSGHNSFGKKAATTVAAFFPKLLWPDKSLFFRGFLGGIFPPA